MKVLPPTRISLIPHIALVIYENLEIIRMITTRVMKQIDSQPNKDFAPSNSAGRGLFDKHHDSCQYHRPSTSSSPEISTLLTPTTPSSNTIANISRESNNNYDDMITTVSSIPNPIPNSMNQDSLDSNDSKGKTPHSTKQTFINSSSETSGFKNDIHTTHDQVSPSSPFNIRPSTPFKKHDIVNFFLSYFQSGSFKTYRIFFLTR